MLTVDARDFRNALCEDVVMEILIGICSVIIAGVASLFSWQSAKAADRAVEQANQLRLFELYQTVSQVIVENPRYLYEIYGLDNSVPEAEARNIAFLGLLVDGFQQFYGRMHDGNYRAMIDQVGTESTFLSTILTRSENRRRWAIIKMLYYGDEDREFVDAVDAIIALETNRVSSG